MFGGVGSGLRPAYVCAGRVVGSDPSGVWTGRGVGSHPASFRSGSVQPRIEGHVDHDLERPTLPVQDGPPELVGVLDERVILLSGDDDPGRLGQLQLELAGAPTRVARKEPK